MSEQYRLPVPHCPLCGGTLEERTTTAAVVDVCADCHAVWIDWFDGDLATVAGDVHVKGTIPAAHTGDNRCPRCRDKLANERLRGDGPTVLRCASCAGVLVPSAIIDEVAALGPADDGSKSDEKKGTLDRLFSAIRSLFSADKP